MTRVACAFESLSHDRPPSPFCFRNDQGRPLILPLRHVGTLRSRRTSNSKWQSPCIDMSIAYAAKRLHDQTQGPTSQIAPSTSPSPSSLGFPRRSPVTAVVEVEFQLELPQGVRTATKQYSRYTFHSAFSSPPSISKHSPSQASSFNFLQRVVLVLEQKQCGSGMKDSSTLVPAAVARKMSLANKLQYSMASIAFGSKSHSIRLIVTLHMYGRYPLGSASESNHLQSMFP